MILMVPDVDGSTSSSVIPEEVDPPGANVPSAVEPVPSLPVYHGSIVSIDRHIDDENTSDLIIRVPNFQRLSPSLSNTDTKAQTPTKRRAPICPVLHSSPMPSPTSTNHRENIQSISVTEARLVQANRLATGLRSLSRAFTHGCRSKRTGSITETTLPRALPDVEIITTNGEAPSFALPKSMKDQLFTTTIPKLSPPKVFFVKRKDLTLKKRQASSSSSSSSSADRQPELKHQRIDLTSTSTIVTTQYAVVTTPNTPKVTSFLHGFGESEDEARLTHLSEAEEDDKQQELESASFSYEVEQQIKAISQLVSDYPVSSVDADSLSTHRYSSISVTATEQNADNLSTPKNSPHTALPTPIEVPVTVDRKRSPKPRQPFCIQTSIFQPDISVVRLGTSNLATAIDRVLPGEDCLHEPIEEKEIEQEWSDVAHSDEDTFAECYEVTYQVDANAQLTDSSTIHIQINLDPSQYRDLVARPPAAPPNEYEKIERDTNSFDNYSTDERSENNAGTQHESAVNPNEGEAFINGMKRTPTHSADDLSEKGQEQSSADSASSDHSSRHCTLQRSNFFDGFGVYISTDIETHREHFIHQVEQLSPGDQAGLKDHDRLLCINGTPVVDEDYVVVLQLIKHGLETDTLDFDVVANEAYEEFKSQINQLHP